MFFRALINTIRWLTLDRQKLIAEGFKDADVFEIDLLGPIHQSKGLGTDFRFGIRRSVFVRDPNLFAAVFKASEDQLDAGSAYAFLKPLFGERSVMVERGEDHLRAKQSIHELIRKNMAADSDELMFFDYSIKEVFRPGTYPVLPLAKYLTGSFLMRTVFGEQGSRRADQALQRSIAFSDNTAGIFLLLSGIARWARRFGIRLAIARQRREIKKFVVRHFDKLAVMDEWRSTLASERKVHAEVVDSLITLLFAGFETTAGTISWLLYEIASRPEIQLELRKEIQQCLAAEPMRYLGDDDTLLARCVDETLRLHPTLPFIFRQARKTFTASNVSALPRDYIVLSIQEMHRRYFGEEGSLFRPERFRSNAKYPRMATFGGGTKTCPGRAIAVQEARAIIALLVSYYAIKPTDKTDNRLARNSLSAAPRGGMVLSFEPVSASAS